MSDRMKPSAEGKDDNNLEFSSNMHDHDDNGCRDKRHIDDFNIFAVPKLLKGLNTRRFGSVSKEIEDLCTRRSQILKYGIVMNPKSSDTHVDVPIRLCELSSPKDWQINHLSQDNAIDLKGDHHLDDISAAASSVADLSTNKEDSGDRSHTHLYEKVMLQEPASRIPVKILMVQDGLESSTHKEEEVNRGRRNIGMDNNTYFAPVGAEVIQENNLKSSTGQKASDQIETEEERMEDIENKSTMENVECMDLKIDNQIHEYEYGNAENDNLVEDDLANLWSEMAVALECSKATRCSTKRNLSYMEERVSNMASGGQSII